MPSAKTPYALQGHDLQSCVLKSRRASKLSSGALLTEFTATLAYDRGTTVDLLIQMGEIEKRKLYVSKACASMYAYCIEHLHMCEGTACRRIRAARVARRLPVILPMLADGTLHLSAVSALAPHLTRQNALALLAEAAHKSKAEVERIVARHFPRPDVATAMWPLADAIGAASLTAQVVANMTQSPPPVAVVPMNSGSSARLMEPLFAGSEAHSLHQAMWKVVAAAASKGTEVSVPDSMLTSIAGAVTQTIVNAVASVAPDPASPGESPARTTPRSAGRFAWQLTADQDMQTFFEEAQQLIGHSGPRNLQTVLKHALEVLVATLRKTRCAATSQPRETRIHSNTRHVSRAVVRAVSERDSAQCTFKDPDGRR